MYTRGCKKLEEFRQYEERLGMNVKCILVTQHRLGLCDSSRWQDLKPLDLAWVSSSLAVTLRFVMTME
jgi:hypothetical protein